MKKIRLLIAIFFAATVLPAVAQDEPQEYNEQVIVTGSYRPEIDDAVKINIPPVMTDTITTLEHKFNYSVEPRRLTSLYEPARIKAARIVGEPTTKLYNNYFRLGFGNYWTPLAEAYFSSLRDKKLTYGAALTHRSSWDKLPDYGPDHYAYTSASAFGKYIVKEKIQLSSDLTYTNNHDLYYGFSDATLANILSLSRNDIGTSDYRTNHNTVRWNLGVKNMELDKGKLGYSANLRLTDLWATYDQNEFNMNLSGDVNYGFTVLRKYKGVAFLHIDWDAYSNTVKPDNPMPLGYVGTTPDSVHHTRNIVRLNPYADFMFRGLQFHVGATAGWDAFTSSSTAFRFFPDVVVSKQLLSRSLVFSLGATGGFDANSWSSISTINPYVAPDAEMRATRHYDFVAHGRWMINKKLEVKATVEYALLRDDLTFCLDQQYSLGNVYSPYYFDNNRLTAGGDITFVNDEMLKITLGGNYYHYQLTGSSTQLLYRPDFDIHAGIDLNYHDKWLFHLGSMILSKMEDPLANQTMPLRYGINAEVEYRHNRALSFFLRADNLAFQRYMLWANYPSQRGIIIAGLTYTLPR